MAKNIRKTKDYYADMPYSYNMDGIRYARSIIEVRTYIYRFGDKSKHYSIWKGANRKHIGSVRWFEGYGWVYFDMKTNKDYEVRSDGRIYNGI